MKRLHFKAKTPAAKKKNGRLSRGKKKGLWTQLREAFGLEWHLLWDYMTAPAVVVAKPKRGTQLKTKACTTAHMKH